MLLGEIFELVYVSYLTQQCVLSFRIIYPLVVALFIFSLVFPSIPHAASCCLWSASQCSWLTAWTTTYSLPTSSSIAPIHQKSLCLMPFCQLTSAVSGDCLMLFNFTRVHWFGVKTFLLKCICSILSNAMVYLQKVNFIKLTVCDLVFRCVFSCSIRDNAFVIFVLIISGVFWLHRLIKFIYNVCCYWEIRSFYINALKMTMVSQTPPNSPFRFCQLIRCNCACSVSFYFLF